MEGRFRVNCVSSRRACQVVGRWTKGQFRLKEVRHVGGGEESRMTRKLTMRVANAGHEIIMGRARSPVYRAPSYARCSAI